MNKIDILMIRYKKRKKIIILKKLINELLKK